ncbi:hypothetical protein [Bradyrhizobium liaoningense]|uniref:hypothetical protein n=1 Tax=Bradyrhizobium liaoningense TaxID=43992 RepID=UPI001BABE8ED|nr:hypothetical protein [Bradyrhizobium liaoningense]MBR0714786.1 hypothetical protein [Bradyrhizobium liaoningense]
MPRTVVLLIFLMMPSHAFAQMVGDQRCKDQQFTSVQVDGIIKSIRWVINSVEAVPPDEAEYMRTEARTALELRNRARFNAVASRRYYPALQFHDDAKVVMDNVTTARSAAGRDLARLLVVVLGRLVDMNHRMHEYIDADGKRNAPVLTQKNRDTMYFNLPVAKDQTVSLLQCVISVL